MSETEFLILDWNTFAKLSLELAKKIADDGRSFDVVLAILRGGYIVAKLVADALGIDAIATVEIKFYKGIGETRERPIVVQPITMDIRDRRVLVVDDVADSGRTLQVATDLAMLRGAREVATATLFYKPWSIIIPDYYAAKTDKWIVFPWEYAETLTELSTRFGSFEKALEALKLDKYIDRETLELLTAMLRAYRLKAYKSQSTEETTAPR